MKPEKYQTIRAKNYCTRCWKRSDPLFMYLDHDNKLICAECKNEKDQLSVWSYF